MNLAKRPCRRLAFAPLAAGALAAWSVSAHASPLDDPYVGGLGWSGPTTGDPAAIYWNPAALSLARGLQVMAAGTATAVTATVDRAPIMVDGASFDPGTATARNLNHPLTWPPGPGGFFGLSWDFGGDRFNIGFAAYTPFVQQIRFPTSLAGDEPTRYHALALDLRNTALVPALAIRLAGEFRIGFAPGFLFSNGRLTFDEDTGLCNGVPCGPENPSAAARYSVGSGHSLFDSRLAFTLAFGAYYKNRNFELGVSYSSRPLGGSVSGVEIAGDRTSVTLPPSLGGGSVCTGEASNRCVFGDVVYKLPDTWTGGITWHPSPGLEVSGILRWVRLGVHDRIEMRLIGPTLAANGLPERIVLHRGFRDVWDARLRATYWLKERVRIGGLIRFETSAVAARDLSPAAIDGLKIEPVALAEVRITRWLSVSAGYGFTFVPAVESTESSFDPTAATACEEAHGDLNTPACVARLEGRARPSVAGRYTLSAHRFGLTATARF